MIPPKPLDDFRDALLNEKEVIKDLDGDEPDDLTDLVHNNASVVDSIQALGEDVFEIVINRYGPVFYISANEFDDIGYFASLKEALEYAEQEFEPYISALAEVENGEDEEDEEE